MTSAPILGTSDPDQLRVDTAVTFTWRPDAGNSYTQDNLVLSGDLDWTYVPYVFTGPSHAAGRVTFEGLSSSETFTAASSDFGFAFSGGAGVSASDLTWGNAWSWDPATGALEPLGVGGSWDNWIGTEFSANAATFATSHWSGTTSDTETGHWVLAPDIHDVDVFGGEGDDTIYGGQGTETLSGDNGNDTIYAGRGDQVVFGGAGNDALKGGVGWQTLDGGDGSDTIDGGSGTQFLIGGAGHDVIRGGSGNQTLWGGAGGDTLWGGSGDQILDGNAGNDVLHAGNGNETLTGGAGRDIFAFDTAARGHDVITDFRIGQDLVQLAKAIAGPASLQPADLAARLASDATGSAVLPFGDGSTVTFIGVSASQLAASGSVRLG